MKKKKKQVNKNLIYLIQQCSYINFFIFLEFIEEQGRKIFSSLNFRFKLLILLRHCILSPPHKSLCTHHSVYVFFPFIRHSSSPRFKLRFLIHLRIKKKYKHIMSLQISPFFTISRISSYRFSPKHISSQNAMSLIKIFTFKGTMIRHLINITKHHIPNNLLVFQHQCLTGWYVPVLSPKIQQQEIFFSWW